LAYYQVLDDVGVLKKIKRLAGSSTGSIAAAMLAVGCDSTELDKFFIKEDINELLQGEWPPSLRP
jgi:predicted acylesterase/phospholipase RssA